MDVLNEERPGILAPVAFARFANGAVERVGPKRLVIGAAIIIASHAKADGNAENQKRRGERQPAGPPARTAALAENHVAVLILTTLDSIFRRLGFLELRRGIDHQQR